MKRFRNKSWLLISFGLILVGVTSSCGDSKTDSNEVEEFDNMQKEGVEEEIEMFKFNYSIPTPNEIFAIIKEIGGEVNNEVLVNLDGLKSLVSQKDKALNFGVVSTDLAYLATFDLGSRTAEYYVSLQKLGDELGISAAFDKTIFKRLEENVKAGDSLMNISQEVYFQAYDYLEENDRGSVLAMVLAGGWIEGVYLISELVGESNDLTERVVDEQYTLENLIGFMSKYKSDEDVNELIDQLKELKPYFVASLEKKEETTTLGKNENGKFVLGEVAPTYINEEKYSDLIKKITALREGIISPNA